MASEEIAVLNGQWMAALDASSALGLPSCAEYRIEYSAALSANHVTIMTGTSLDDSHLAELKIRIGHRKDLKLAAAAYLPHLVGATTSEQNPSSRLEDENSFAPHTIVTAADKAEANEGTSNQQAREALTNANLSLAVYHNACGVQWRSISGTAPNVEAFYTAMQSARDTFEFPASFDRAWQDNRPMPFHYQEDDCNLMLIRVPNLQEETGVTVATITNRLVIMYSIKTQTIVTYHRCERDPLEKMGRQWVDGMYESSSIFDIVDAAIRTSTRTYKYAVRALQIKIDEYEDMSNMEAVVEGLTILQKKAAVYRRCVASAQHMMDELMNNSIGLDAYIPLIIDALSTVESQMEEIIDNTGSTIDMQMALDGFRASSNTKIFTYISVVCQPIGLATGWFGMNFSNMPELAYENSYFVFIAIVLSLALLILVWLVLRSCRYGF